MAAPPAAPPAQEGRAGRRQARLRLRRVSRPFTVTSLLTAPQSPIWLRPRIPERSNLQDLWKTVFQKCALNFHWANSSLWKVREHVEAVNVLIDGVKVTFFF